MESIEEEVFQELLTCGVGGYKISDKGEVLILAPEEAIETMQQSGIKMEDVSFEEFVEHFKEGVSEIWY